MSETNNRPKYLNLIKIRLPVTGVVSILHRITGVLMFLCIPFLTYLLHLSTTGPSGFEQAQYLLQMPVIKVLLVLASWSLFHHLFAGIRYLLIDIHIGVDLQQAITTAYVTLFAGIVMAIVVMVMLP